MKITMTVLIFVGLFMFGNSIYMQVKAVLAQVLINHTWDQRQKTEQPAKPWPWADTRAVAILEVPIQDIKRYVMQDANGESLAFGPGLMTPNVLPAGDGHSIIAGHRDSHFEFLQEITIGDQIYMTNFLGQQQSYRVVEKRIINSNQENLVHSDQVGLLTLVTCYPFNKITTNGPLRLVINAKSSANIYY